MSEKFPRNAVVCSSHFKNTYFLMSQKDKLKYYLFINQNYRIICSLLFLFISSFIQFLEISKLKVRRLKPNVLPSLNLPREKFYTTINTPTKEKIRKRSERAEK